MGFAAKRATFNEDLDEWVSDDDFAHAVVPNVHEVSVVSKDCVFDTNAKLDRASSTAANDEALQLAQI